MLIDCSYFVDGPRHIQNATIGKPSLPNVNALDVCAVIEAYIAEYQQGFLIRMLGEDVGYKVDSYLAAIDEDAADGCTLHVMAADDKLRASNDYGKGNYNLRIYDVGNSGTDILESICERLRESFADYVFYKILRDSQTQATITGLVRLKCANDYVSPIRRQVTAWNRMVDRNRVFASWVNSEGCQVAGIDINPDMVTKINTLNL